MTEPKKKSKIYKLIKCTCCEKVITRPELGESRQGDAKNGRQTIFCNDECASNWYTGQDLWEQDYKDALDDFGIEVSKKEYDQYKLDNESWEDNEE